MNFIKQIVNSFNFYRYRKGNIIFLVYHDISDRSAPHYSDLYSTPIETFKSHIHFLRNYFEFISINDIYQKKFSKNKNYICITFDDGFRSVKDIAFSFLNNQNIPFSVFINFDAVKNNKILINNIINNVNNRDYLKYIYEKFIEKKNPTLDDFYLDPVKLFIQHADNTKVFLNDPYFTNSQTDRIYLNEQDVLFLKNEGIFIGNHSKSHKNLKHCDPLIIENEIVENKTALKNYLDEKINAFAIPFGKKEHYSNKVIDCLQKNNTDFIFTTNPNKVKIKDISEKTILYPRIGVTDQNIKELRFLINRTFVRKYDL
jgi:peptidoglycan/xylan/chitin deacetylase (PgdA/CDA1 family)